MNRRFVALALTGIAIAIAAVTQSCSSTPATAGIAEGCSLNSDCNAALVCVFSRCHAACAETRDCPTPERCTATESGSVCLLDQEKACSAAKPCTGGLVCAESQCRNACSEMQACGIKDQVCVRNACFDPNEVDAGFDAAPDTGVDAGADTSVDTGVVVDAGCIIEAGADAGPLGYSPSNFDPRALAITDGGTPDGGVSWTSPPAYVCSTASCTAASLPTPVTITLNDATQADLYIVSSLTIQSSAVLTLLSNVEPRPVILAVVGDVDIQGDIAIAGAFNGPGSGGNPVFGSGAQGPGGGGNGLSISYPNSAAGGGSFCGVGGGAAGVAPLAPGGSMYGHADLIPLVGGSAGGYANGGPGNGYAGAGGGALQISAGGSITIRTVGSINAGGSGYWGGGGSGGAVLLEAPIIRISGRLGANGGGGGRYAGTAELQGATATATDQPAVAGPNTGAGSAAANINGGDGTIGDGGAAPGSGGGGAGRLRINTWCGAATIDPSAIVSPHVTTVCATQGTLKR